MVEVSPPKFYVNYHDLVIRYGLSMLQTTRDMLQTPFHSHYDTNYKCWNIVSAEKYMINSDQRPDSNRHPLTSLSHITVRFKGILKSASFPNSHKYDRIIAIKSTSISE
jgi:hypothetical protein